MVGPLKSSKTATFLKRDFVGARAGALKSDSHGEGGRGPEPERWAHHSPLKEP